MRYTVDDTLVMLAELQVKPEALDAFMAYTVANLQICRAQPGNLRFDILLDPARPEKVRFHEVWASAEAQQAYMAWRTQAGDFTTLMAFLAAPPTFTALRCVATPQ